jgi:hypothetical protein
MTVYEFGQKTSQLHNEFHEYVAGMDICNLIGICVIGLIVGFISFTTYLEMRE